MTASQAKTDISVPWPLQMMLWGYAYTGHLRPLDQCWEDRQRPAVSYRGWPFWDRTARDLNGQTLNGKRVPDRCALPYVGPHDVIHAGGRL